MTQLCNAITKQGSLCKNHKPCRHHRIMIDYGNLIDNIGSLRIIPIEVIAFSILPLLPVQDVVRFVNTNKSAKQLFASSYVQATKLSSIFEWALKRHLNDLDNIVDEFQKETPPRSPGFGPVKMVMFKYTSSWINLSITVDALSPSPIRKYVCCATIGSTYMFKQADKNECLRIINCIIENIRKLERSKYFKEFKKLIEGSVEVKWTIPEPLGFTCGYILHQDILPKWFKPMKTWHLQEFLFGEPTNL